MVFCFADTLSAVAWRKFDMTAAFSRLLTSAVRKMHSHKCSLFSAGTAHGFGFHGVYCCRKFVALLFLLCAVPFWNCKFVRFIDAKLWLLAAGKGVSPVATGDKGRCPLDPYRL